MDRVTASIDSETLVAIKEIAGPRGVSAFLQTAAKEKIARVRLLTLLDDLDRQHGAPDTATRKAVAREARRIFRARRS